MYNSKRVEQKIKNSFNNTLSFISPIKKNTLKTLYTYQNKQKENVNIKFKTYQKLSIISALELIYNQLNFNEYDSFPIIKIDTARKNIESLYYFLKQEPICFQHQQLLNLYCENHKQLVCIQCVHVNSKNHQKHRIKSAKEVMKNIEYDCLKQQQAYTGIIHQLYDIKDHMKKLQNQINSSYQKSSLDTNSIIDGAISDLQKLKYYMEEQLSNAYRRTISLLNNYSFSIQKIIQVVEINVKKLESLTKLSKYLLFKQLNKELKFIQSLVFKFKQNKFIMQQWQNISLELEKMLIKKKSNLNNKNKDFLIRQF